jgi:hypothetical protein
MPIQKRGKPVRSGATPGAAGVPYNPGGVGRTTPSAPIYQGARSPGAAGTMANPGSVGRTVAPRGTSGVGAATGSYARMPGTTASSGRTTASGSIGGGRPTRRPVDPGSIGVAGRSRTAVDGPRPQRVTMGPSRPAGSALGAMHGPPRPVRVPPIPNVNPKGKLLSNKGLMIGAGAAVIAGLAMNRRGDGTSSGRSSLNKY